MNTNTIKSIKEKSVMSTIYKPTGRAGEYGEYALNIYQGCPHRCVYCYASTILHKDRTEFHASCTPRPNIVQEVEKRLAKGDIKGKHIFLCFTCDPFPMGIDHEPTREIIKMIHDSGNYVQILTKGRMCFSDRMNLNSNDIYGITISCGDELSNKIEPNALKVSKRIAILKAIKFYYGCKTFVSCEPVFEPEYIYELIKTADYIDEFKIGKLNYMSPDNPFYPKINWKEFGEKCERLCKEYGRKYYIKESLRKCMEEL